MNPAHLPDIDNLMEIVVSTYDEQGPGVQARVERTAAALQDQLGRRGPVTARVARDYFERVIAAGMAAGIGPDPTRSADVLGWELAGAALLRRQLEGREGGR